MERAVATMQAIPARVIVGVPAAHLERARELCGPGAVVVAGGATHRETTLAAFRAGDAPLVLIHDVAHPFVTRPSPGKSSRRLATGARRSRPCAPPRRRIIASVTRR